MLTKCVGCGKKLKDTKVRGLARCPTCGHYWHRESGGKEEYNQKYYAEYLRRAETELGKKIVEHRWKLLTKISGIPLLEAYADRKWGRQPEYEAYKAGTSVLILKPPLKDVKSPINTDRQE